jgi:hypothetical protein
MPGTVEENAGKVLAFLYNGERSEQYDGPAIAAGTGLVPDEINDAVTILVENSYAEWQRFLGTAPWDFGYVEITPRGRYQYERQRPSSPAVMPPSAPPAVDRMMLITAPPQPMGSPYGFEDEDWEIVAERKGARDRLNVVLGYQFASPHYTATDLRGNLETMFSGAVAAYNALPGAVPASLSFRALSAGYGEHLFNEIARDIISADIAVFDTSDLNPNVMLELGVALTWGVRVLVIKKDGCAAPPSDLSGQTWADYRDSARSFVDPGHGEKLVRMVERAVRKKARV